MPFSAPAGTNFRNVSNITIASLKQSLEAIAEFIKSRDTYGYLLRFDDWWQQAGEPMPKGKLSWEAFADRYEDDAAIAASMPKRDGVRVGICGPGMEWYLRYIAVPADGSASLDLTIPVEWEEDFREVTESLSPIEWAASPAEEYIRMIRLGATPVNSGRAATQETREARDSRIGSLADNVSFGGGFARLFTGKFAAIVIAALVLFLGYLWLSKVFYLF
jgi:hypothetical protein